MNLPVVGRKFDEVNLDKSTMKHPKTEPIILGCRETNWQLRQSSDRQKNRVSVNSILFKKCWLQKWTRLTNVFVQGKWSRKFWSTYESKCKFLEIQRYYLTRNFYRVSILFITFPLLVKPSFSRFTWLCAQQNETCNVKTIHTTSKNNPLPKYLISKYKQTTHLVSRTSLGSGTWLVSCFSNSTFL